MKTYATKQSEITRSWRVVDADGATLGRLATQVAAILRGKHKPTFSPHLDTGDPVIVVNAAKVRVTGNKLKAKNYVRHSGYPEACGRRRSRRSSLAAPRKSFVAPSAACSRRTGSASRCRASSTCTRVPSIRTPRKNLSRSRRSPNHEGTAVFPGDRSSQDVHRSGPPRSR